MLRAVILTLQPSSVSPGGLVNTLFAGLLVRATDSGDLGQGLRSCISYKSLGDADVGWGVGGRAYFENHWLKVGKLWQGWSLSFLHSCIRNKLHLFVYIVTMAASMIQWQRWDQNGINLISSPILFILYCILSS